MKTNALFLYVTAMLGACVIIGCGSGSFNGVPSPETRIPTQVSGGRASWRAQEVIDAFLNAGLAVGEYTIDDPTEWNVGSRESVTSYIRFFVPDKGLGAGGLVIECPDEQSRDVIYREYEALGYYESGIYWPYVMKKDNILLQLNGMLTSEYAEQYFAVLDHLGK